MPLIPDHLTRRYLADYEKFFDRQKIQRGRLQLSYRRMLSRYYCLMIPENASVLEIGCAEGSLLSFLPNRDKTGVDLSSVKITAAGEKFSNIQFYHSSGEFFQSDRTFDYIIVSDTLNYAADVQKLLQNLLSMSHPETRVVLNFYNTLYRPLVNFAAFLGMKPPEPASSWLSADDVLNLLALSGWDAIKSQPHLLIPFNIPIAGSFLNRYLAPLISFLNLTIFTVARPVPQSQSTEPTVSIVIPARNEAGNIESAIQRIPKMGKATEIIFVEGHSLDNTWEEIQRVVSKYGSSSDFVLKAIRQTGRGKGNAVREGFAIAMGDILMILDADLTMPPEELPKFYEAIRSGKSEFANGVRLVYPMEKQAMRFLNMCANKFFSIAFTWILGQPIKDTLCGTKVLSRKHYEQIARNRIYFGDFDPFGDFDLIFGAAKLNLKFTDIPIRYQDRSYGETNISRWKHGWLLLKMTIFAATKLKFI